MATITGGGSTTTLNAGSNDTNGVASNLSALISQALANGSLTRTANTNPTTGNGLYVVTVSGGQTNDQPAVSANLIAGGTGSVTVVGAGGPAQLVLGDNENITYFSAGGSGTIVTGDGNNLIGVPLVGGGTFSISTGTGNDTIDVYSGVNTVSAGTGSNIINVGQAGTASSNLIYSGGNDRIIATGGIGTDTVIGGNGSSTFISEASKNLIYNSVGTNASVTIAGGTGTALVNLGSGTASIQGGSGADTVFAGLGNATIDGGAGADTFVFLEAGAQASRVGTSTNITLFGFRPAEGDKVSLVNYAAGEAARAVGAAVGNNGSVAPGAGAVVTLSDGVKITFVGVTNLSASNFSTTF